MIDYLGSVKEFHEKYGHYISNKPVIPPERVIELRYRLIEEEMNETLGALRELMNANPLNPIRDDYYIDLADGIADSIVVLMGTILAFGIPIEEVFKEVHRSNMSKSTETNEYGKTIKGPNYSPPDIKSIIHLYLREEPRTRKGSLD
jgi:predicted HAD superfamily Cof-like phosphohydrolase